MFRDFFVENGAHIYPIRAAHPRLSYYVSTPRELLGAKCQDRNKHTIGVCNSNLFFIN